MDFVSTTGQAPSVSFKEALFQGLAPDGGLYLPGELPVLSPATLAGLREMSWPEIASRITRPLLSGSIEEERLASLAVEAFQAAAGLEADLIVSPGRAPGARILSL